VRGLDGKVALITGAARGQGRSHAIRLASEGVDIIAVDICGDDIESIPYPLGTAEDLEETVNLIERTGRRIVARKADVRSESELADALSEGVAALGRLDIVIANAGIGGFGLRDEEQAWNDMVAVNLTGVWRTIRLTIPTMISQGQGGSIVLISSTAGLKGVGSIGRDDASIEGYVASKHGVVGLMRQFAKSLAPHRIRVNSIHPTGVNTPMVVNEPMKKWLSELDSFGSISNLLPVELIEPVDVSNAIAWLVSDEARYVTGVALPVDAGFNLR
jgi:SDR family mycofactocin-dependent oxidoreductase